MDILKTQEVKQGKQEIVTSYDLVGVFANVTVSLKKTVKADGGVISETAVSESASGNLQDKAGLKDISGLTLEALIKEAIEKVTGKK